MSDLARKCEQYSTENLKLRNALKEFMMNDADDCESPMVPVMFSFLLGCVVSFVFLKIIGRKSA